MADSYLTYDAWRLNRSEGQLVSDHLVVELPLSISLRGEPLTVTMHTPGNELAFTRGLLYTEGIWKHADKEPAIRLIPNERSGYIDTVDVELSDTDRSAINKRSLLSVSACGICGKSEFRAVHGEALKGAGLLKAPVPHMFQKMREKQVIFQHTGGCHAAAAFNGDGEMLAIMEDIGRHNAVDKVIGQLLCDRTLSQARYLAVSGRVSYEIVAKAFAGGIPVIAAVSSVSSLAVDFANELGITLIGFCRDERMTIYSHPERVV
jgi:FdhD protein